MAKLSIKEELELLRAEVATLKAQQEQTSAQEAVEEETLMESLLAQKEMIGSEFEEHFKSYVERLKEDYEHISPSTAVTLFALGALFGRAISK